MMRGGPRKRARLSGLKFYFSDGPCKRGHTSERVVSSGMCLQCHREKVFPSQSKERYVEYSTKWRKKHPAREKEVKIRYRYGLELSQLPTKPNHCEICERAHKKIVLDHCHASGAFRGWICDPCNMTLGAVNDDPEILSRLIEYLNKRKDIGLLANGMEQRAFGQSEGESGREAVC